MEKISGIIPANSRVTTVDLRGSGTARSGTPGFGREVANVDVSERRSQDTAARASFQQKNQMALRTPMADPKAAIVQKMADNFFMNRAKQLEQEDQMNAINPKAGLQVENEETKEASPKAEIKLGVMDLKNASEAELNEEDAPAVGKYIDVQA